MYKSVDHSILDTEKAAGKLKENPHLKIIDSIKTLNSEHGLKNITNEHARKINQQANSPSNSRT